MYILRNYLNSSCSFNLNFFQGVNNFFDVWLVFFLEDEDDIVYKKETEDIFFINHIQFLKDLLESLVF